MLRTFPGASPLLAACLLGLTMAPAHARGNLVLSPLDATYFEVLNGTGGPDFGGTGFPEIAQNALGPNGMPVVGGLYNTVKEFDPSTHELTWWNPALNSAVIATGAGTITVPPVRRNLFAPNSTGTGDSQAFETAIFRGTFSVDVNTEVDFILNSNDDSFVYIDGRLVGQEPGIKPDHDYGGGNFLTPTMSADSEHSLEIFFADRAPHTAFLTFVIGTAPEPAPGLMLVFGLAALGLGARRRRFFPGIPGRS
jgi:hypothetical protein